ncbi:MAG: AsmA family protein, partial [Pseudomonadota bacterium]
MRRLIIILPAIVVLLIGALIAIAVLIPKSVYRTQIQTAAEASLGREVNLDGPISLSFFPRIAASVSDVTVANPDGFSRQNIVEAGQLRASVKWGPLLTGSVRVQEMALIEADVELERLEDGRSNWEFGDAETDTEVPSPAPEGGEIDAGFDQIRIVRSNLTYSDAVSETAFSITDFDLAAEASSLSEPLKLNSSGLFDDNAFNIALELSTPNALLSGE